MKLFFEKNFRQDFMTSRGFPLFAGRARSNLANMPREKAKQRDDHTVLDEEFQDRLMREVPCNPSLDKKDLQLSTVIAKNLNHTGKFLNVDDLYFWEF